MRRTARTAAALLAAVCGAALGISTPVTATAAPGAGEPVILPFTQTWRRCDHSKFDYIGGGYYGRPNAAVRVEGGEVVADLQFATGVPNTPYDVRLIQVPRSSAQTCNPGDPGVAATTMFTDGAGGGSVTVRAPIAPGATGAWLSMTRPNPLTQTPLEFYTSTLVFGF